LYFFLAACTGPPRMMLVMKGAIAPPKTTRPYVDGTVIVKTIDGRPSPVLASGCAQKMRFISIFGIYLVAGVAVVPP
jgi:hypothetical protein